MLTPLEYERLRFLADHHNAWTDTKRGRNGWASYRTEETPPHLVGLTNDDRSAIEVYEFMRDRPSPYFLYVNEKTNMVTTWTGDILGAILEWGVEFRDNFGGRRVPIRVRGANGVTYAGTYFKSAGSYARVKAVRS